METKKESSGVMKMVLVSAVTTVVVFVLLAAVGLGAYYFLCCEPVRNSAGAPAGEGIVDRIEKAARTVSGSTTDAAKITSISFTNWGHAGPLYPDKNDPPGYVFSSTVEFRRDLTAQLKKKTDYDRDLPDEVRSESATLTAEQFENLAAICSAADVINEPDSKNNISEGGTTLIIEHNGVKKSIVTSNYGVNTEGVKKVLEAIEGLKRSLKWVPAQ